MVKFLSAINIAILTGVLFSFFYLWTSVLSNVQNQNLVTSVDRKIVDYILKYRSTQPTSGKVGLIAVDAKSVKQLGRWPWPRRFIRDIIRVLNEHYQVAVIGFDIVFSEPDTNYTMLKNLLTNQNYFKIPRASFNKLLEDQNFDKQLSDELISWGNVVEGYFFRNDIDQSEISINLLEKSKRYIKPMKIPIVILRSENSILDYVHSAVFPEVNVFDHNLHRHKAGFFSITPDGDDGVVRRVESVYRMGDDFYPSLPIKMYQYYMDKYKPSQDGVPAQLSVEFDESGMLGVTIGDYFYPTDGDGTFRINFRGPEGTIKHFSFVDVLNKTYPKEDLKDKLVFIGVTELGVFDIRSTPVNSTYPGLEVQGTVLDNLILKNFLVQNGATKVLSILSIILICVLVGLFKKYFSGLRGDFLTMMLILCFFIFNYYILDKENLVLSFAYPILGGLFSWFFILIYATFTEGKDKRFIKSAFGQYLAPKVIDELINNPEQLKLGGSRKSLTIMFTDLQGFSAISEKLSVDELSNILNEYLTRMVDIIMQHEGTVDKFHGDAIMAFWGAPIDSKIHAQQACKAAVEMQLDMEAFRKNLNNPHAALFHMRIGINTGDVMVGNFGADQRMDYTVIGDAANLASRLEGANKMYGSKTLISENTKLQVENNFEILQLDEVRVVGKKESIKIYELQGFKDKISQKQKLYNERYQNAFMLYQAREWKKAEAEFRNILKTHPQDQAAQTFIARIEKLLVSVPPDWSGVYQFTSK